MKPLILNHTIQVASTWETVLGFPSRTKAISMQCRDSQTDFLYRYRDQTGYWTVKSGQTRSIAADLDPNDLQVYCATQGAVIEIECSTQ